MDEDLPNGLSLTIEPQRADLLRADDLTRAIKGLRNAYYGLSKSELQVSALKENPIAFCFVGRARKDREWAEHLVELARRADRFLDAVLKGRALGPFESKEDEVIFRSMHALAKLGDYSKCHLTVEARNGDDAASLNMHAHQAKRALKLIAAQSRHRKGSRTKAGQAKLVQELEKIALRKDEDSLVLIKLLVNMLRENSLEHLIATMATSLNNAGQAEAAKRLSEA